MNHPNRLYRYRPMKPPEFFALQEIICNTAYFCPLDKLNDPDEGTFSQRESNIGEFRSRLINLALKDGELEHALLLHFLPDAALQQLEADMQQVSKIKLDVFRPENRWGVVCFTKRYDNTTMWERYADQGRGLAIEYDLSGVDIPPNALWEVQYDDSRGSIAMTDVLDPANAGSFSKILSFKTMKWSAEEEWRLLTNFSETASLKIPISRIILGPNMSNDDKNRAMTALVQRGKGRWAELMNSSEGPNGYILYDP